MTVTELAELSNLTKSYISQVKHGKCPPSKKLLNAIARRLQPDRDYLACFLQSRQAVGVSPKTLRFYKERLSKFTCNVSYVKASRQNVETYLNSIPANQNGFATRHASYRAIRAFYNWLNAGYDLPNPIKCISAPIMGKPILPALDTSQVLYLIEHAQTVRDKAIIALFTESGLRLSELTNISPQDFNWGTHTIKVMGKGRKEAYAPFGELSASYLKQWLSQYKPNGNIWGINEWGIVSMLRRLEVATELPCNPHTFRRTFACLLRKQGLDVLTIKDLGRWESLEMVQRYTRSVTFQDSMKFYKGVLGQ